MKIAKGTNIYINKKSFAITTPRDFFVSEYLQAISKNFSCIDIDYNDFSDLIFVTDSKSTVLSIRRILMLNHRTVIDFIRIENYTWMLVF